MTGSAFNETTADDYQANEKSLVVDVQITPSTREYCNILAQSDMIPSEYRKKPANVLVAVQMGMALGMSPIQAIQKICVINGRPALFADAMLAVVRRHKDFKAIKETMDETGATCTITRKGEEPHTVKFTKDMAKRAGLLNKPGPWTQYPERMLQLRARSFALRDSFADVLSGLSSAEEARDIKETPVEKVVNEKKSSVEMLGDILEGEK